jgi:hypothetical protein
MAYIVDYRTIENITIMKDSQLALSLESLVSTAEKTTLNNDPHLLSIQGFPKFEVKRSRTWRFDIDPWDIIGAETGTLLFRSSDLTFTKYESEDKTFITFSAFDTPQGWDCRTENNQHELLRTQMLITNKDGGLLDNILLGREVLCSSKAMYSTFTKDYPLYWYDLIANVTLHRVESYWRQC